MRKHISRLWTAREETLLLSMRSNGATFPVIGKVLARSASSVGHKFKALQPKPIRYMLCLKIAAFLVLAAGFLYLAATTPTV